MSWGTCYGASNNIHFDFPPLMSDGRNFANWYPACDINKGIRQKNNITSNYQYRQFLIKNADSIIKKNQRDACDDCCGCWEQFKKVPSTPESAYLYKSCTDNKRPYGYETSDLKNLYLTSFALQSKMQAPILTQEQYLIRQEKQYGPPM